MKKLILIAFVTLLLFLSIFPVYSDAESFPHTFWQLSEDFLTALDSGDDDGIIEKGIQICDLLEASPKNNDTVAVLATRYQDIALAYERKENFASSSLYYEKYIPYGEAMGWADGVKIARAKIECYTPQIQMYRLIPENQIVYGAKNEPASGVLFGRVSGMDALDDSMTMLYIDLNDLMNQEGIILSDLNCRILQHAADSGKAVEVAVNFPISENVFSQSNLDTYYNLCGSAFSLLAEYAERVPMYIRIGAEPDVWEFIQPPTEYIRVYRMLASLARDYVPSAALVWSINYVSSWGVNADDYYPGDDMVDWVGISLYAKRYFLDKKYEKDDRQDEILFHQGRAADPVLMIKRIVDTYGDRKPIMLSECGVSHRNDVCGNSTDWAVNKIREYYGYIPMVYPQVKLISYFNYRVASETDDYSLNNSKKLQKAYHEVTRPSVFIKNNASAVGTSYTKLIDGDVPTRFSIGTYVHLYDAGKYTLEYIVDGVIVKESHDPPYRVTLELSEGSHEITVQAVSSSRTLLCKETVTVNANAGLPVVLETAAEDYSSGSFLNFKTIVIGLIAIIAVVWIYKRISS